MKATKGEAGYIQARKKQLILKAVLEFGIVIALLILGIWQTHTRLNLLTVVAVLGCLPAAKALVEVITISPYHSIAEERAKEIQKHAEDLTVAFDLVFTSKDKFMPVDSIIILDNTICGYSSGKKNRSCLYRKTFTSDAGAKSVYKSVCENFYGLYCIPCKGRKYAAYGGNKQT